MANSWTSLSDNGHGTQGTTTDGSYTNIVPPKEKKRKNLSSLATLRKRLVRRRRTSKCFDHNQIMRDFISSWTTRDIKQLCEEYECSGLLKELSLLAESARPLASTTQNDLCELYDFKYCSDITLVYKGVTFPVHKAIVCVRCPAFRELLNKKPFGSYVTVNLDIPGLRVELLNDLLRYLYSGELSGSYDPRSNSASYEILVKISEKCGVPNPLAHDLKHLLETGLYSDASLFFSPPQNRDYSTTIYKKCRACSDQAEYACHRAILAARSPFFRNVIQRQERRKAETDPLNSNQRTKIVLDESIISRRFARVILHVMYRDCLTADLIQLLQSAVCKCSNELNATQNSVTAIANSSSNNSSAVSAVVMVKEVMDLYEISRFLELDSLVQSCEDLMIDSLSLETLIMIMKWSEQPHGSPWVKRQALCFLREEFSSIASSPLLCQLELTHLMEALKSDFLQSSELEVLQSVIKWGENRLTKRMEEREPNVVINTAHSLRRGLRKKELDDTELRDIISELMCHVRIGHILPLDSEILSNAAKRGLISTLPPYMLGEDAALPQPRGITAWFRGRGTGPFIRPRFFGPYCEEAKAILEERIGRMGDIIPNRINRPIDRCIPDALTAALTANNDNFLGSDHYHLCISSSSSSSAVCYEDIPDANSRPQLPILEERIVLMMRQREQELKSSGLSQRALALVSNRCEVLKLIQLRVVREFGLPDAASDVLHGTNYSLALEEPGDAASRLSYVPSEVGSLSIPPPPRPLTNHLSNINVMSEDRDLYSYASEIKLESSTPRLAHFDLDSQVLSFNPFLNCFYFLIVCIDPQFSSNESRRTLSDLMPDIAIATTAIEEFHLAQRSTDAIDSALASITGKLDFGETERPHFV